MDNNSDKKDVDIITFIKAGNYKLEILNYDVLSLAIIYGFITALISAITIFFIKNMYPGLLIGFISGFLNIIIVKILFMVWHLYKPDNTTKKEINIRSYIIYGFIVGVLDFLVLYIIFMIND